MFTDLVNPQWKKILVIGASADSLLQQASNSISNLIPNANMTLVLPSGRTAPTGFSDILQGKTNEVTSSDFTMLTKRFDAAVLVMAHVNRPSYSGLVWQCSECADNIFLYSTMGLQPLDLRDGLSNWPEEISTTTPSTISTQPTNWVFFRPCDQTVFRIAEKYAKTARVNIVETLSAFEKLSKTADAAFFDWCLSDYRAVFNAFSMAGQENLRREAFIALDMVDLAEKKPLRQNIEKLNQSAFHKLDYSYILSTRLFIADRYNIKPKNFEPAENIPDENIWKPQPRPALCKTKINIVYHGLLYFWHEVAEFAPVLQELKKHVDEVTLDIYGRVHESSVIGPDPVFPQARSKTEAAIAKMCKIDGVTLHGYTPTETVHEKVAQAHFYLGITAANTLMSKSEMRTGVVEALKTGARVLHKKTTATELTGLKADIDYIDIDSNKPQQAAAKILEVIEEEQTPPDREQ